MNRNNQSLNIFISYSHKNMKYKDKLLVSLEALKQSYNINTWHDGIIDAGSKIDENVKRELEKSEIVLLLITDSYLASYYCMKIELEKAIEREKKGKCKVIPVIFEESVLVDTLSFFNNNRVPKDGKPITQFRPQSKGCTQAVNMIKDMIDRNFPKCKKEHSIVSSTNKIFRPPIANKIDVKKNDLSLHINLYKNGKIIDVPINQDFLDLIPKYHNSINTFSMMIEQSLLDAKKRYSQCCKNYKSTIIPQDEKLNHFRLFLMEICVYTKTYITEPTGIKVHFRVSKDNYYLGLIASTDEDDSIDLSSDWTVKMTPIPMYSGLIYHSSRLNAPLLKSLNPMLNYKCKNNDVWKDYVTFTFPSFHTGQTPLISYCISIHKDYYKVKMNMLKILAYLNFGSTIEKYVLDYCSICKKMDKTFNLEDIIKTL